MKLTLEQISSVTVGAVSVVESDGRIIFHRFTEAQEQLYFVTNKDFYKKCFATAGISLDFLTDSNTLSITAEVTDGSSRTYFNHDIYVNGELKYVLSGDTLSVPERKLTVEGTYVLGEGEKRVTVYMPWSCCSKLISLELDDGSKIKPVKKSMKMIIYGDSITQGYDAANPSASYASLLADALNAEAVNKGIGGEVFRRELAELSDVCSPDIITVAYGTNDWNVRTKVQFYESCKGFYEELSARYPRARIFALTPVWRGNFKAITKVGDFDTVAKTIGEITAELDNVTVIDCSDFIPRDARMYSPDVLHPNFLGFEKYAEKLVAKIKEELSL